MDRALLERMIGAVVLIALIVIVAPALLNGTEAPAPVAGSSDGSTRTEVIVLNPDVTAIKPAAGPSAQTAVSRAPAVEPEPAVPAAAQQRDVAAAARRPAAAAPAAPSSPQPVAKTAPPSGFAVQLGSFAERANAQRFATRLKSSGVDVFVVSGAAKFGKVYRVYAGPAVSREAAEKLSTRLAADGHSVMVVDLGAGRG